MDNSFSEPNPSVSNPTTSTSSHAPVSSDTNQPTPQTTPQLTTDSPASSSTPAQAHALPVSSTLPTSSPPPHSSPTHSTAQPPHSAPPVHLVQRSHYVPPIQRPILDLSLSSTTPESAVKRALLSDDPSTNSIALVGMGGAGKTTILCALGNDSDVMDKYHDGVWFFELGHDVTLSSFVQQLEAFVKSTLPEFSQVFTELAASEHTHRTMVTQLMKHLVTKHFLLLFDDVWDVNASVYKLVCVMCNVVQSNDNSLLRMLTSTRSSDMADDLADVTVPLNPEELDAEKALGIFCRNAKIDTSDVQSLSAENQHSLQRIIETCAGLALALSVAGSGVRQAMDRKLGRWDESAISVYWGRLKTKPRQLGGAERGGGHPGLTSAVETSVQFLEERWESTKRTEELADELSARDMFRSLCIVQKQMIVPVNVFERMWGVGDVQAGVAMLSRNSLVSEVCEEGQGIVKVRVHDLVLDMSVKMSEREGGVEKWHGRLVDTYVASGNGSNGERDMKGDEWWELKKDDKYMRENVVRHLLGAGRVSAALKLLTDYRWIEKMNKDEERPPFQKVMSELELVRRHLGEKTETRRRIVHDVDVVARAMELCVPYCVKNREECTFQLFGRLRDVKSESGIVERIVSSIEEYAERPWARCGPGVLTSGRSSLRRVLELEDEARCMCVSGGGEEVIVGGESGKIWVLDGRDGRVKKTLVGDNHIVGVFFDCISGLIYSCNLRGQVTIWKEENKLRSMHVQVEDGQEEICCMQVLPSSKKVVLGTSKGRLLWMDTTSGRVVGTVAAHSDGVSSLAVGGSETVFVSGSYETIRAWDTKSFDDSGTVFKGLTGGVTSVALSADGRLLASSSWSSDDRSVRLWDVPSGEPLWTSPAEYDNRVDCMLFSGDDRLLYCMGFNGTNVWRVGNGGRDVSLAHTLPISATSFSISFGLGDGPELFVLRDGRVQVWDARQVDCSDDSVAAFLQDVRTFGVSENGTTMLTCNFGSKRMEIRNVCDVCDRIDRVISSFEIPAYDGSHQPESLAISNNQRFVAYSVDGSCVVHIVDAQNGNVLHSLYDLDKWALSSTRDEQDNASNSSNSTDSSSTARVEQMNKKVGLLSFSSDSTVISAFAAANPNPYQNDDNATTVVEKSVSWNVSSGEPMGETRLDADSTATSSTATPRLVCNPQFDGWSFRFPRNVKYEHGQSSFTIATMEDDVREAHYFADTSRLLLLTWERSMSYVDLITDNTHLPPRNAPPLPLLKPHPNPPPPQHTITDSEPDQVYDVFISHAGTDKFTIALLLYNLLVALDFKVFLDRPELRPGENAPEKMIKAMRTAKIAVVILSPEYAARKWTLKELMCFLERYRAGGEREIIIIPVFYRLTLDDCRDEKSLFGVKNDKGENVFLVEGFLEWMSKQKELTIEKVLKGLQSLRGVTGIENEAKVTNGKSEEEKAGQMQFAEKIRDAVVEAKDRQNSKRAAGPSSAR